MQGGRQGAHLPAFFRAAIRSLMDSSMVAATIAIACRTALLRSSSGLYNANCRNCVLLHLQAGNLVQAGGLQDAGHWRE